MADAAVASTRPPFWRNIKVLRYLGQAVFILLLFIALRELYLNLRFGLARQGVDLGFDFLDQRAGFGLTEGISYNPNQTYWRALQVGVVNTIRAAAVGIVLASLLGLVIGVARLSTNWLIRKVAQVYVEFFRNVPLLVQLFFWFFAVILALPAVRGEAATGIAFLSNRGAAVPWLRAQDGAGTWGLILVASLVAAWAVRGWRIRLNERTGRPARSFLWAAGTFLVLGGVSFVLTGSPLVLELPHFTGRGYRGGLIFSAPFAAIVIGLTVYTAAFIAEIVRGSILAVEKGQKEAAMALGLMPRQQLRLVVLPQALRIAIPPLNNQFQNLTKNSSLAAVIAYPELVFVSRTIANQAGRATQVLLIVIGSYLVMTLTISFFMNLLNRAVAYRGSRS